MDDLAFYVILKQFKSVEYNENGARKTILLVYKRK